MFLYVCIFLLFAKYETTRYYSRSRSYLDYYPFGPKQYPTTPLEKLHHDLEILKEQTSSNSTKIKSKNKHYS